MIELIHGDCLEVMKGIPDNSISSIICDLPYGTTNCSWDVIIPFDKLWEQLIRIAKDDTPMVFTASQPFTSLLISSNLPMYRCNWVYQKSKASNYLQSKHHPMKYHEDICVFSKKKHLYNPQMTEGKPYIRTHRNGHKADSVFKKDTRKHGDVFVNNGTRYPSSIIPIKSREGQHSTSKPVELMEYLIKTYSNEGDTVLDMCAGSCTTGVAAINTGRNAILIEKERRFVDIGYKRLIETHSLFSNPQIKITL